MSYTACFLDCKPESQLAKRNDAEGSLEQSKASGQDEKQLVESIRQLDEATRASVPARPPHEVRHHESLSFDASARRVMLGGVGTGVVHVKVAVVPSHDFEKIARIGARKVGDEGIRNIPDESVRPKDEAMHARTK
jgi:hypothetical protein